jgi:hypothetical protein
LTSNSRRNLNFNLYLGRWPIEQNHFSMLGGVSSIAGALASGVYTCPIFRFTIPLQDAASLRMNIVRCCAMINDSAHWPRAHDRIHCICT